MPKAGIDDCVAYQRDVITAGDTRRVSKPNKWNEFSDFRKIHRTCSGWANLCRASSTGLQTRDLPDEILLFSREAQQSQMTSRIILETAIARLSLQRFVSLCPSRPPD